MFLYMLLFWYISNRTFKATVALLETVAANIQEELYLGQYECVTKGYQRPVESRLFHSNTPIKLLQTQLCSWDHVKKWWSPAQAVSYVVVSYVGSISTSAKEKCMHYFMKNNYLHMHACIHTYPPPHTHTHMPLAMVSTALEFVESRGISENWQW